LKISKFIFVQLHTLQPNTKNKKSKRVGRGGKRGTYSGKGIKGQKSRSGRKFQPSIRELIKRYPKLRGYRYLRFAEEIAVINLATLDKNFSNGGLITPDILVQENLIKAPSKKIPQVKILAKGEITKKLTVQGCLVSKRAKEKIEKEGGVVK